MKTRIYQAYVSPDAIVDVMAGLVAFKIPTFLVVAFGDSYLVTASIADDTRTNWKEVHDYPDWRLV